MSRQKYDDAFRVKRPSMEKWTKPDEPHAEEAWIELLSQLHDIDPKRVRGYRIQVNFKPERAATPSAQGGGA